MCPDTAYLDALRDLFLLVQAKCMHFYYYYASQNAAISLGMFERPRQ